MKSLILLLLLFFAVQGYAAQKITIPVGTTSFGPISPGQFDKWAHFSFSRALWTNPASFLLVVFEVSTDKQKTWKPLCSFRSSGGPGSGYPGIDGPAVDCPLPPGATNVRGVATVTGGEVVLTISPNFHGKP